MNRIYSKQTEHLW